MQIATPELLWDVLTAERPELPTVPCGSGAISIHFWDEHDLTDCEDELEEVTEPVFACMGEPTLHLLG